jgi:hypothetical protein
MNKIILLAFAGLISANAYCQRSNTNVLKLAVDKAKHFAINTSNASIDIEGYDGDELIVEATTGKVAAPVPPEAEGLIRIPFAMRPGEDNTISYKQLEQNSTLHQISISTKCNYLHIKVPNNIKLFSVNSTNSRYGSYLTFSNYKGAFQLDGTAAFVKVSNIGGPFKISARAESLSLKDVSWSANAAWPVLDTAKANLNAQTINRSTLNSYPSISPYIIRTTKGFYSNMDIAFPAELKADLYITSREGSVYSDLPLSRDVNITNTYRPIVMNGGGLKIEIDGGNGDIYLKKQ